MSNGKNYRTDVTEDYRDGWDRIFAKRRPLLVCDVCGRPASEVGAGPFNVVDGDSVCMVHGEGDDKTAPITYWAKH